MISQCAAVFALSTLSVPTPQWPGNKHDDHGNDDDNDILSDDYDEQSSFQPDVTFDAGNSLFDPQLTSLVSVILIIDRDDDDGGGRG